MIKIKYFPLVSLFALASCVNSPKMPVTYYPDYSTNPIFRSAGNDAAFVRGIIEHDSYSVGQKYDIGVYVQRVQWWDGTITREDASVAFDQNQEAWRVDSAAVDGTTLKFYPTQQDRWYPVTYDQNNITPSVNVDSMEFSYFNYDKQSATVNREFKTLGAITIPDTISLSKGFKLSYANPLFADSLIVSLNTSSTSLSDTISFGSLVVPDTGSITIPANLLPIFSHATGLSIGIRRFRFIPFVDKFVKYVGILTSTVVAQRVVPIRP